MRIRIRLLFVTRRQAEPGTEGEADDRDGSRGGIRGRAGGKKKVQAVHRIERLSLLLVALATLLSLIIQDRSISLGVGIGGALATFNFYALRRIMQSIFEAKNPRRQAVMAILLTLKFAAIAASIYLILKFIPINAVALLVGISVVVLAIFVEGFRTVFLEPATPIE